MELTVQWEYFLWAGPVYPTTQDDLEVVLAGGIGKFHRAVGGRLAEEFRKGWLPYFCRSGQRQASLEEFAVEVDGWLPLLPEISLPVLIGEILADEVRRKSLLAVWVVGVGGR